MAENAERARGRLNNIRTVQPLLDALRTISMGSWQGALKRRAAVQGDAKRLRAIQAELSTHIAQAAPPLPPETDSDQRTEPRIVVVVIGSERGLCGRFSTAVVERADTHVQQYEDSGTKVELVVLGSRAARIVARRRRTIARSEALSGTSLPRFQLAHDLCQDWLRRYEAYDLDQVDVVHNRYLAAGRYQPSVTRVVPPIRTATQPSQDSMWPPPIVETDPVSLYTRIVELSAAIAFYELLLDSATAEHSTRFQLMEEATSNADRLIDDLTREVQMARRQAITAEMQELAVGAGLLKLD
ncbi:MAG: F0F1 ATP synthase subunit gamma [Anaerolineae bacterium]